MNNINEIGDTPKGQYALGRVAGRAAGRKDYRKKGEFSRKDVRNLKWTEGLANTYHDGRIGGFADGFNDAYMKEYGERCGEPYEKWNESKEVNRKLIRLTESDLHKIVKQSVNKILKESSWADGAEMTYAYHWLTLGASEEQQDADAAYHLYDLLSHNEYNVDEAIKYIQKYGYEDSAMEQEAIPRDSHIFGRSSDGKYILTYDTHTGAFDVWKSASMNESIEYHGPTPFSIGDVAYHNQQLRGEIKDIIEFCDIAKNIPQEHKHANFYTQLIKNLHDLDTHAWWDLDNAEDI